MIRIYTFDIYGRRTGDYVHVPGDTVPYLSTTVAPENDSKIYFIAGKWVETSPGVAIYPDVPGGTVDSRIVLDLTNIQLTINGSAELPDIAGMCRCEPEDTLSLTTEITLNGLLQTQITFVYPQGHPQTGQPIRMKLPFVRHAAGKPVAEEVYLNTTIVDGMLSITGKIPASGGDWKIIVARCNDALKVVNAPFKFKADDVTFLA